MSDDRDKQYQEYLSMRQNPDGAKNDSIYERLEQDRIRQERKLDQINEEARRQREMEAYIAARSNSSKKNFESRSRRRNVSPENPGGKRKKKRSGPRIFAMIMLFLLVTVIALTGIGYAMVNSVLNNIGKAEVNQSNIGIDPGVDNDLSNYRNIAVLGIDSRDMDDDSDARSDSIIIASIDKETNEIKMFSVYRDTMLDLGEDVGYSGLDKVTHAYYYGKSERALYTLNKNLDLNIKEVVVVSWKAVADGIDAVGGIELDISEAEKDEMNKFIKETANKTGIDEKTKITKTGKQHVNGVQAVTYARIRKDALTGDYRRNERMKIVVKKAFDKAVNNMDFNTVKQIATVVLPEIKTNIDSKELMEMMINLKDFKMNDTTTGWPYDVGEWTGDAWYGPPRTLYTNVSKLHEQFFGQEGYVPTSTVENISYNISVLTNIY